MPYTLTFSQQPLRQKRSITKASEGLCTYHLDLFCCTNTRTHARTHTHTHTRLTAIFPGIPGWAGTRKVKPIWILLKQETVSGSGISWAVCKSALRSRQIATPALHHSVFYRPHALPATQPTASKHWRHTQELINVTETNKPRRNLCLGFLMRRPLSRALALSEIVRGKRISSMRMSSKRTSGSRL